MAKRRNPKREIEERLDKTFAWCKATFPAPLPVVWSMAKKLDNGDLGLTEIIEGELVITISSEQTLSEATETFLHEWAHILTWPFMREWQDPHEDTFWIFFGRIYRRWHDQGGKVAALDL